MTIRVRLNDGAKTREQIYRKVYKGKSYAQLVENFYSFKNDMKWGYMEQLKGKDRIGLHSFGSPEYDDILPNTVIKGVNKFQILNVDGVMTVPEQDGERSI